MASPTDPQKTEVAYQTSGGPVMMGASSLVGGNLGGLVAFRSQTLEPAQKALDDLAIGLASTFNAQHQLGWDLDGNPGGDFFSATSASDFSVAITDPRKIAAAAAPGAVGDNGNALLLGALQTANTMNGGTTTYQGVYSQLVSQIGNKTRELDVTSSAAGKMLSETTLSIQNESGVNLDEEAANLLRYQQAYQAAGKVMQIASEMFDVLLSLGQ
jgi:flagellar hook-associated protein 1 FlgK